MSTEDQAANGSSLQAQEDRIRAFAAAMNTSIDTIIVERGASGKSLERPEFRKLLAEIKRGSVSALYVLKLDRLTRSVKDLGHLIELFEQRSVALISVSEHLDTSSAAGRLMLNLLSSISQWEREAIGERTSMVLDHKRRKRIVYGPVPFGWRNEGGQLQPIEQEQQALQAMRQMREQGRSYRELAEFAQLKELRSPQGGTQWYPATVRAILNSRIASEESA